ncbi:MAG: hypothetical protein RL211_2191 [Pseudomonadota bacterium]|jgi:predicted nucleic acid-binding protein
MNVVDSCGWLEYFGGGPNAGFFAPAIEEEAQLLVPALVVYEVSRRLLVQHGTAGEARGRAFLKKGRFIAPDFALVRDAALAAHTHKLAMADAVIWQTAQVHQATLYTQDLDLKGLPGVKYRARNP